jgi:hypothetical protein
MGEAKRRRSAHADYEEARRQGRALGDGPVQDEYHAKMAAIVQALDEMFNEGAKGNDRKTGFVLMVFPFGDDFDGRCNYMSNGAAREDIVTLMKEMIARFSGQPEIKGSA